MDKNKFKFTHIPMQYQKTKDFDERFFGVKIYVLHTGENYNGSIFEKETVNQAIPSIANTPLLAFVKYKDNEKDFAGHEIDLVIEDGEYKWKYKGSAYGVIPETHNARWEMMVGDDGVEREYLVVDAIVWKKFEDVVQIFDRDLVKGQSMELSEKYSGHFDESGLFIFDSFKFDGCAILGKDVQPAMNSAKVEMQFSNENLSKTISDMMKEYHSIFKKEVNELNIEALLLEYGLTREQVVEAGLEIHSFSEDSIEEFKKELERIKRELEDNKEEEKDDEEEKDEEEKDDEADFKKKDEKSEDDKDENKEDDEEDEQLDKDFNRTNEEGKQKSNEPKNNEENGKEMEVEFEKLKKDFAKVVAERDDLIKYKKNRERDDHKAKVEALIKSFEKLNENDVKEIREKVFHFTVDEIEEKLYAILGKKGISDKQKKQSQFAKFYVADEKQDTKASYDHYFKKHLEK